MITRSSQVTASFFNKTSTAVSFPQSYQSIWHNTGSRSNITKVKALLKDYTKENFFFGSFLGRLFSGHWGRHHVDKVHELIYTTYECVDDLVFDLKQLKPQKGGSLDRRICFIDAQIAEYRRERVCFMI